MCGQYLEGFKDLGIKDVGDEVAVVPPLVVALRQAVPHTDVRRSGLGTRHRYSSSKGTLTLIAMETGKRVRI